MHISNMHAHAHIKNAIGGERLYCIALIKAKIKIQIRPLAPPVSPSHIDCAGVKPSEISFGFPARSPSSRAQGRLWLSGSGIFSFSCQPRLLFALPGALHTLC